MKSALASSATASKPTSKKKKGLKQSFEQRFGLSEGEVLSRTVPDYVAPNLDLIIVGINPGLTTAATGHYYSHPSNHFWRCMTESGLVPAGVTYRDDAHITQYGIGLTNICSRTSRTQDDLSKSELAQGAQILRRKIHQLRPLIVAFNGKGMHAS